MVLPYKKYNFNLITWKLLTKKDISLRYVSWLNTYEVVKHTDLISKKHTLSSVKKYVSEIEKSKENYLYGIFYHTKHIGNVKVGPILSLHKTAYISYIIGDKNFWNCGLGTHVIKRIKKICKSLHKLKKLNAGVSELHKPSQLVLTKNQFKFEGNFKKQIVFKKKRYDLLKYGCLL